jgi:DNA polymerase III subunit delta
MPPRPGVLGYQEFMGLLDRGTLAPLYLLTGEEDFLIQSVLDRLVRVAVDPAVKDFNFSVLDGETATADALLTAVESLPAFSERRLVVLKSAEQFPAVEANRIVNYLNNPTPTTCFVAIASKFDARRSFFQALKARATVVDCLPLKDAQVTAWIKAQARSLGSTISEDAVLFLKERVGRELFPLHNELLKAMIGSDHPKTIELEDVQRACTASGSVSVYDLLNALSRRGIDASIRALDSLLDEGEPPLKILSTMSYRFRMIWKLKQAMRAGHSDAALLRMFGLGQWAGTSVITSAKKYSEKDLRWAFQRLIETDAGLKGGLLAPKLLLEMLVMDLCSGKQKGLRRFLGRQSLLYL